MLEADRSHDLQARVSGEPDWALFRNFKSFHEEEEADLFHMVQNRSSRVKAPGGIFQLILRKNFLALGITSQWKGMTYCGVSFLL